MLDGLRRVFGEGFRIFFLGAALFGIWAMLVWERWMGVQALGGMVLDPDYGVAPHLWHAHEMVFGYGSATLAGFLLTAAPNWTGAPPIRPALVAGSALVWLAGRVAIALSGSLSAGLVAFVDLAFLPLIACLVLALLLKKPAPRNLVFMGLLALFWSADLVVHLDWLTLDGPGADAGLRAGLLTLCAMIAILGGRITPAFTRNAMSKESGKTQPGPRLPVSRPPVAAAGILCALALPLLVLASVPTLLFGSVAVGAGLAQIARLSGWRSGWTLRRPILWSLHLGFVMLGLGYLLLGFAALGVGRDVAALHVLGIGAVGGMTLAVMSRAVLGHTGRPLVAPLAITCAFALMPVAALLRWAASSFGMDGYFTLTLLAGAAWILALSLFVLSLAPALFGPRLSASA